jgi:hypothetical protein
MDTDELFVVHAGHRLLLVAATAESEDGLRAWLEAAGAGRRLVVHLTAQPATLEERIRGREPAEWFGLSELLESAERLAAIRFAETDLELSTETHGPDEVAASVVGEVRMCLGDGA